MSNTELSADAVYYTSDSNLTSDELKTKRKCKFEKNLLVWVAFSEKGFSRLHRLHRFQWSSYRRRCLFTKMFPLIVSFIKENHKNDQIVFWSTLTSSKYSNKTLKYLSEKNTEVVPKNFNPANCPELRPIEDFWSEFKRMVYEKCWEANNLEQLPNRIDYAFKKVTPERVNNLASSTFRRIDATRRGNV